MRASVRCTLGTLLCLGLSACGLGLDEIPAEIELKEFNITGSQNKNGSRIVIDQNSNNGKFDIDWYVSYSGGTNTGYFMQIYFSTNGEIEDQRRFFYQNCDVTLNACNNIGRFTCSLSPEYQVSCRSGDSPLADTLLIAHDYTKLRYVVAKACMYESDLSEICDSVKIEIQVP